jgi:valyl-tRNA synthetase
MNDLPKTYDPAAIEQRWADFWVREKLFECPTPPLPDQKKATAPEATFTLALPPPNVTGRLHMGHMLNHTQMDIIVRWHFMRGFRTLWLPGTDHASIAMQMMVERQLASEGVSRRDLGREQFIEKVWEWKQVYGGAILEQMKRLGDSVDWHRLYFTMDEKLSRAVRECFVRLWNEGLIYRGKYIVNWCPRCGTAISDLEVIHEEFNGKLYQIKYPVVGSGEKTTGEFLTVATTRPETMLGDVAVAVNAADERYKHLHGKKLLMSIAPEKRRDLAGKEIGREIPIIIDELANPEFGTGAVKVTPAHDPNDFAAGKRHNLPQVDVMDDLARMNANAGAYSGLDRYDARERVLHDLQQQGLLDSIKEHVYSIGKCDRCKTVVEPRLSKQWFVAVNKRPKQSGQSLAERGIEVARNGEIRFTPANYKTIYLNWMENLHDWCISRQLWWGHRIPAWHCAQCGEINVSVEAQGPAKCGSCGAEELTQEDDVLDTWFSSGLLPMSALGWPEKTRDLEVFYPTSLLITAYEILFLWVSRMIMLGCHFMQEHQQQPGIREASGFEDRRDDTVPFREVYIHALVRDAERQKMSKTKGNVIDPIEIINQYGTDAVRFTLASMAAPGTDIAYNEKRTEGYRAFANKIWNAARFLFMNIERAEQAGVFSLAQFVARPGGSAATPSSGNVAGLSAFRATALEDRWILSRFSRVCREVNSALAEYRFHEAAQQVYSFFWDEFCDWYIELLKLRLNSPDAPTQKAALGNAVALFEAALRLLSPFMPFLTEELWHAVYQGKAPQKSIALSRFPQADAQQIDADAEREMATLQELIVTIRNLRAELKVEPRQKTPVRIFAHETERALFDQNCEAIERLANVAGVEYAPQSLAGAPGARSTASFDVQVVFERKVDAAAERERLSKELTKYQGELANAQRQLGNENFLSKAPANVVEGLRRRAGELELLIGKTQTALGELRG